MTQFSTEQYEQAIEALELARSQTIQGKQYEGCSICGDEHPVYECGRNPLVAMSICADIAQHSNKLHDILHYLSGYNTFMGEGTGPAKVIVPDEEETEA